MMRKQKGRITLKQNTFTVYLLPWLLPLSILIGWQVAASLQTVSSRLFPPPLDVLKSTWELLVSGKLLFHMKISLWRAAIGFLVGGAIGFILGISNALFTTSYRLLDTTIQMIRNIPHLALVPLVILWMGVDEGAKIFLVALGVLFPIYINTFHGIRSINKDLIEMGKVYGLGTWPLFRDVILPGALPSIFVGLRYALGVMWLTLIVAETIPTNEGIGFLAMNAREFMHADIIILSIIVYALLGKLADVIAKSLEKKVLRWNDTYKEA